MTTKLCLIGLMGSGKSTLGKALATRWNVAFVDLDTEIETRAGRSITSIFEQSGESAFRLLERETLDTLLVDPRPLVIATGGGAPCQPDAMERIHAHASTVWLDAPPDCLARRILDDPRGDVRPLLSGLDLESATARLETLLETRRPFYSKALVRIDATLPLETQLAQIELGFLPASPSARLELALPAHPAHRYAIELISDLPGPTVARAARETLHPRASRALVVTDSNVAPLYADGVEAALHAAGFQPSRIVLPAGEPTKSFACLSEVLDAAFAARLSRHDAFIALGGGVIGDLTGFAASIFQRGVPFIQVPTTLLSQVDSAVGGKTAINHARGKNLIGTFWQPTAVISSQAVLRTLPEREFRCGLAEAIKHGFIASPELVEAVVHDAPRLRARDAQAMLSLVHACCRIKGEVVADDEREDPENGRRAILNFGHTFGHAFEKLMGYGRLTHGEAVALGMVYAARLSERTGVSMPNLESRITHILDELGLPCRPDSPEYPSLRELIEAARGDKKASGDAVRFVLLEDFGRPVMSRLTWSEIADRLTASPP